MLVPRMNIRLTRFTSYYWVHLWKTSKTNFKLTWQTTVLYGFHVEILLAIFLASPQFSGQYSLFLPSSVSKASTKEQIASKGHCRHINSHNYRGKFPEGMMTMNEDGHGKMKETLKVYRNWSSQCVEADVTLTEADKPNLPHALVDQDRLLPVKKMFANDGEKGKKRRKWWKWNNMIVNWFARGGK